MEEAVSRCSGEIDAVINRAQYRGPAGPTIVAYEPQCAIGAPDPATSKYISAVISGLDAHLRALPDQETTT